MKWHVDHQTSADALHNHQQWFCILGYAVHTWDCHGFCSAKFIILVPGLLPHFQPTTATVGAKALAGNAGEGIDNKDPDLVCHLEDRLDC